jgi:hypothetical protein
MRDEKITCDYCRRPIDADREWMVRVIPPLGLREPFTDIERFDCCIECMSELEAKRRTREAT